MTHAALALVLALAKPGTAAPVAAAARPSFEDVSRRADAARLAENMGEALRLYREAVALRPQWDEGWWYVATLTYDLDLYAEARDAFKRFVALKPDGGAAWAFLGFCEHQLGEYEMALQHVARALELGVSRQGSLHNVARYHAGVLYNRFGKFEHAWQQLEPLTKNADSSPDVATALGITALRLPLLPNEIPPEQRELVQLAGRAAYAQAAQRPEAAGVAYGELLARYANVPNIHYPYGVFLLGGDADRAIEEFKRELALSPLHVEARLQLAYEYLKRGEHELALPYAEEATRLAPNLFSARNAYGRALLAKGDAAGAVQQLEVGVALAPGSAPLHFALSRAYALAGRAEDANKERAVFQEIEQAQRAIESAENRVRFTPKDPSAHRELAEAYRKARREADAKRELALAQQLDESQPPPQPSPTPDTRPQE